jgi:hypothetical protein
MFKILYFVCLSLLFTIKITGQQDTIIYNPSTGNYTVQYIGENFSGGDTLVTLTYIPWTKLNPFVKCEVSYYSDSSEYIYNWTIGNGENSEQSLKKFVIVFGENAQVVDKSKLGWYGRRWKGSKDGEVIFLNRWGWTADQGLESSWSVTGLKLGSSSLPTIGFAYFQGKGSIPKFPYAPPPAKIDTEFVKLDGFPSNYVRRETVVPGKLSDTFIQLNFLDTLISYKHQSVSIGWIDNQGIINSLDSKLDSAKMALTAGDSITAKNILNAFINEVEAQKDKHLTSEAYALLKFNAEYLIEKLK